MNVLIGYRIPARIRLVLFPRPSANNVTTICTAFHFESARRTAHSTCTNVCGSNVQVSSAALSDGLTQEDHAPRLGQVISSEANFLRVKLASLPKQDKQDATTPLLCQVRGVLKKKQQRVLVGDNVRVGAINWKENRGMVEAILPRSSQLTDPAVANVNNVVLLFSLTNPPFEEEQVSRFLVSVEATHLPLTLILNKGDLVDDATREQTVAICRSWGYEPFVVSCSSGAGVREVAEELRGKVSVVAGPSGVGKSSLINVLRLGKHRKETVEGGDCDSDSDIDSDTEFGQGHHEASSSGHSDSSSDSRGVKVGSSCEASSSVERSASTSNGTARRSMDVAAFSTHCGASDEGGGNQEAPSLPCCGPGDTQVLQQLSGVESIEYIAQSRKGHHLPVHDPAEACSSGGMHQNLMVDDFGLAVDFVSVGELSKIKRGTHTTRTVSLLQLPGGGLLADSPGFNQPGLDKVASQDLMHCFPEMRALMDEEGCRFRDCLHIQEPGCCINEAGLQRWPFYLKLLAEVQAREQHEEQVLQLSKRQREGNTKVKIGKGGTERHELRLSAKKHRRVSRSKATQQWQQALDE